MATSGLMMHLVVCLLGICITILRNITCYFRYSLNLNAIVQETIVSDREMFPSVLRNNYQPVGDGWMSLGQGDTFVVISASLFNCFSFIQIIRNFSISSRVGDVFLLLSLLWQHQLPLPILFFQCGTDGQFHHAIQQNKIQATNVIFILSCDLFLHLYCDFHNFPFQYFTFLSLASC